MQHRAQIDATKRRGTTDDAKKRLEEITGAKKRRMTSEAIVRDTHRDALDPIGELDGSRNVRATFLYAARAHVPDGWS